MRAWLVTIPCCSCSWRPSVQEDLNRLLARGCGAPARHGTRHASGASWLWRGVEKQHVRRRAAGFVTVVLKAAKLREEAQTSHEGSDGSLQRAIVEAENEVEMLAFLLEEADSSEAEVLLEMEAQLQEPKAPLVAAHLRAQIAELQGRKQRSLSPPDRAGHGDGDGEVSAS
ncbi:unnamed protein product [Symbiodinium sp. CCMP2592]|nr:unnamed protein product [Symbiodinium sp. CCMP2592]